MTYSIARFWPNGRKVFSYVGSAKTYAALMQTESMMYPLDSVVLYGPDDGVIATNGTAK